MNMTNFLENKLADLLFRNQSFSAPGTVYFTYLKCTHGARLNSTAYVTNDTVGVVANDGRTHLYKCTTGGTTAASQGTLYAGTADEVITDGSAVFTEQSSALDSASAFVEPSGGSYARVAVTSSLANWAGTQGDGTTAASSGTSRATSNNAAITSPTPTADWGFVWGFALYDASTSGNPLFWGSLAAVQEILTSDSVSLPAATLRLQLTGAWKSGFANKFIDWLLRGQTLTLPASVYIALMLDNPGATVAGSEVSVGGYGRVAVARSLAAWAGTQASGSTTASSGTGGETSNNATITFGTPSANWGTVRSVEIFDASTAGESMFFGDLGTPKTVLSGNAVPFAAGTLKVRFA